MNTRQTILFLPCALSAITFSAANAEPLVERFLASQCAQCHGTDGRAVGEMDGLAGAEFKDLYDKLLDIKRKDDHDVMHFQIQGYTDDQLWWVANYYSGQSDE